MQFCNMECIIIQEKSISIRQMIAGGFKVVELSSVCVNWRRKLDDNCRKSVKHSFVYDLIVIFAANLQK